MSASVNVFPKNEIMDAQPAAYAQLSARRQFARDVASRITLARVLRYTPELGRVRLRIELFASPRSQIIDWSR